MGLRGLNPLSRGITIPTAKSLFTSFRPARVSIRSVAASPFQHRANIAIQTIRAVSIRSVAASPFQHVNPFHDHSRRCHVSIRSVAASPFQQTKGRLDIILRPSLNPLSRGITIPTTGSGGHCRQYPFCLNPLSRGITIPTKGAEMFFPQFGVSIRSVAASPFQRRGRSFVCVRCFWSQSAQSRHHHSNV